MDHLGMEELQTATAWDADGEKLGNVSQVHLDGISRKPAWVTVGLGLLNSREHFIPLAGARLDGDNLYVAVSGDKIKDAPDFTAEEGLTPEQETELRNYYGV
ncbi:PRC-barrel domain-containing protein [Arthrobacter sp. 35/47]|uniref:PRC-barrel domain-containing protein n=1 Tax=Arthrobacter sp. 35/47 TaxID=269454 RepID=UPI00047DBA2F|nr:PRC-barrel domain-containing protein [Arthrobacter sp. 35/47]